MSDYNGELPDNWRDVLPEDMRGNGVLETVKNINTLAKMAVDGRALANTAIRIPSEDASADDQKAFKDDLMKKVPDLMFKPNLESQDSINDVMKTLGMPTEAEGYTLPEMPDTIKDSIKGLTVKAHEAGMTNKQFSAITGAILDDYKHNSDEAYGQLEVQKQELQKEWGAAYKQKVETISHFAKQTGFSDDFIAAIDDGQIDMANMKAFDNVVQGFEGEAIEIGRQPTNPNAIMTPAEADSRLDELMGNKDHAYWHPENPGHAAAKEKVIELGKLAETGKKTETEEFRESLMGGLT